jgi:hypothetical protein
MRKWRTYGQFYPVAPENCRIFSVKVKMIRGVPKVRVNMSGSPKMLVVDTGSSKSLIQPGVSSSVVIPTNVF